jgi:hypothetical protein
LRINCSNGVLAQPLSRTVQCYLKSRSRPTPRSDAMMPGSFITSVSNTTAAPVGRRLPCSQFLSVRTEMPSAFGKAACVTPSGAGRPWAFRAPMVFPADLGHSARPSRTRRGWVSVTRHGVTTVTSLHLQSRDSYRSRKTPPPFKSGEAKARSRTWWCALETA